MQNRRWRLNHLYRVIDKNGRNVPFRLNWAQSELLDGLHNMNCILKARQLGFSTFISLYALDTALFNSHVHCGTIAHSLDAARVFLKDKIRFAYDQLPEVLRAARPIARDSADEIIFDNGSTIRVGVSMRSATLNVLHISELGAIAARFPERSREIRTGALNTLAAGQTVFLECTAAGQEGDFYDICEAAQSKQRLGTKLTPLEWRFFFAVVASARIRNRSDRVAISADYERYFDRLEATEGIVLSPRKRAWYALKAGTQLADMREISQHTRGGFRDLVEGASTPSNWPPPNWKAASVSSPPIPISRSTRHSILALEMQRLFGSGKDCSAASACSATTRTSARASGTMPPISRSSMLPMAGRAKAPSIGCPRTSK